MDYFIISPSLFLASFHGLTNLRLLGSFEEIGDRRNHRLGCFFHQPMS